MPDYIRVRDKETGHHVSLLREQFDADPDPWVELKQDATYPDGSPLPPKFKTTVSSEAASKNTDGGQAADPKEK